MSKPRIRNPHRTPQMVTVNRIFLLIGLLGILAMAGYVYWDKIHPGKPVPAEQSP